MESKKEKLLAHVRRLTGERTAQIMRKHNSCVSYAASTEALAGSLEEKDLPEGDAALEKIAREIVEKAVP